MKIALTASLALALTGSLFAQSAPTSPAAPTETKDKVSYSIGADIGSNLKRAELDINPSFLAQGIQDSLAGKTSMTEEEMKATLQTFQAEMQTKLQAKQKAAGEKNKADAEKYLEDNKKQDGVKTTASGLQYKVITEGKGPKPKATDTVSVNYRGTLLNGTEFDKSKAPVTFPLEGVIPGWTEALQLMPVGSKWQLVIPPALAYGENAPPMIGPNQVLLFEVELLEIKAPEKTDKPAADKAADKK